MGPIMVYTNLKWSKYINFLIQEIMCMRTYNEAERPGQLFFAFQL